MKQIYPVKIITFIYSKIRHMIFTIKLLVNTSEAELPEKHIKN